MPEGAQRLASLIVVGGPLDGRRYDLEEVVTEVLVGSDPDCHLHVDVEGISPIHARLWTELNGAVVHETRAPSGLFVNDHKVDDQAPVKEGDALWLGPPGEPGSVHVECRFEPWVEVLPEVPVDAVDDAAPAADEEAPVPLATLGADEAFELDLGPGGTPGTPPPAEATPAVAPSGETPPVPDELPSVVSGETAVEFSFDQAPDEPPAEPPSPEPSAPVFEPAELAEGAFGTAPTPEVEAPPPERELHPPEPAPAAPEAEGATSETQPVARAESPASEAEPPAPVSGATSSVPPAEDAPFVEAEPPGPGAEPPMAPAESPASEAEPPSPVSEATSSVPPAEDALFVEAEPLAPEAEPPVARAEPPSPESEVTSSGPLAEDALFVEAEPSAPETPEPTVTGESSGAPSGPATPGGTPPEDDPFFVGEPSPPSGARTPAPAADDAWAIASPEEPPEEPQETPPPSPSTASTDSAETPGEEEFFVAEEVPGEGAPSAPLALRGEDLLVDAGEGPVATPAPPERAPLPPRQTGQEPGPELSPEGPPFAPEPPAGPGPSEPVPPEVGPSAASAPATAASADSPAVDGLPVAETPSPVPPEAPPSPQAPPVPSQPGAGVSDTSAREPGPAPVARRAPAGAARRRPAGPRRATPAGVRRTGRRRPRRGAPEWVRPVAMGAGLAVVLGVVGFGLVWWLGRTVTVEAVSPTRARVGQDAVITGSGFSETASENTVLFGGARATVLAASKTRLEVEVPEAVVEAGAERSVPVVVRSGRLESEPVQVSVFQGPRLHGLSPDVALPGEEVLLAGAGWGIGASVRFGTVDAEILEIDSTRIRAMVPELPGGYGSSAPVVVTVGGVESNPAPFFVGRVPLVTSVAPQAASEGDVLKISGRGFERDAVLNDVRVGGVRALVVSASAEELQVVVPRLSAGDPARSVEVRVPDLEEVGRGGVTIAPSRDPVGLRFVAEPFTGPSAHPHAVVSTDLGPAFVLAASGNRSAAERALSAQQALNAAVPTLASAPGIVIEARNLETSPVLALSGGTEPLLEVTPEDAAAYNEDWTRLRGRARPVTPSRLARWWEVVARDLVLVLLRGEPPQFAAGLATEGRVFQQVYDAARRGGGPPVSRQVVEDLPTSVLDGLRVAALRVPVSVTDEVVAGRPRAPASGVTSDSRSRDLELDGTWAGSENEQGNRRFLTVTFRRDYGSIAYEGGITFEVPFLKLERLGRDRVRFTVQVRGGIRHYHGTWNGETLSGDISRDEAGSDVVGHFELRPR